MQYSVFICDLDHVELVEFRLVIGQIIDHGHDSLALVDLGDPKDRGRECFSFFGVSHALPTAGPLVI